MRRQREGLATALLIVLIFSGGCAGRGEVYTAGLQSASGSGAASTNESDVSIGEYGTGSVTDGQIEAGETNGTADGQTVSNGVGSESGDHSSSGKAEDTGNETGSSTAQENTSGGSAATDGSSTYDGSDSSAYMAEDSDDNTAEIVGYVYVCGAVLNPGVYPMTEGMRIYEALALAGGFTEEADEEWLNQAEPLYDGERLYVYTKEETQQMDYEAWAASSGKGGSGNTDTQAAAGSAAEDTSAADASGKVNLNTADRAALMTLPGIGETKADAIIAYREQYGAFSTIEDVQKVTGIKSAVFSKIKDLITV